MNTLPADISRLVEQKFGQILSTRPIGGGCINHGMMLEVPQQKLFFKWNDAHKCPGMFEAERKGLELLSQQHCIRIPKVIEVIEGQTHSGLLLEFIPNSRRKMGSEEALGRQLACLHRCESEKYGLDHSNFMGSLPQDNSYKSSLYDFFIGNRLEPQLQLGLKKGAISKTIYEQFQAFYHQLPELLMEEKPALIHGDLWNGNYVIAEDGEPVLIDPAVAYGNREMDIAMTTLFGGFGDSFYAAYNESYPLQTGYAQRFDIYNLYPLLVHVNLFGGGYLHQVKEILQKYL
jgi:protein-ribulosamine 3-kinase